MLEAGTEDEGAAIAAALPLAGAFGKEWG